MATPDYICDVPLTATQFLQLARTFLHNAEDKQVRALARLALREARDRGRDDLSSLQYLLKPRRERKPTVHSLGEDI